MKICESDITNAILSYCKIDIKSLLTIKYYNSSEKLELQLKPNDVLSRFTLNHIDNLDNISEGGFFVISIEKLTKSNHMNDILLPFIYDYRVNYSDFIESLRDNKLKEIGL